MWLQLGPALACLHPVAEDHGSSNLVDDLLAVTGIVAGFIEELIGGDGAEALVP